MNHKEALIRIAAYKDNADVMANIATEALQSESESEWISVEDSRKPKDAERVLVYIDYIGGIQVTGYLFNGVWNLPNFVRNKVPTHWMPLPQAPKTPKI